MGIVPVSSFVFVFCFDVKGACVKGIRNYVWQLALAVNMDCKEKHGTGNVCHIVN
jgi:hypothetical protein